MIIIFKKPLYLHSIIVYYFLNICFSSSDLIMETTMSDK
jgi:hypothetical protein